VNETRGRRHGRGLLFHAGEVDGISGRRRRLERALEGGVELCTWPAGEDPALLVQIGPALPTVAAAVALGDGYRTVELDGMSGPAALALEAGEKETVAVLAMSPDKFGPVGLGSRMVPIGSKSSRSSWSSSPSGPPPRTSSGPARARP
jgi:hypothetical protein